VGGHDPGVFDVVINASSFGLPAGDPHPFPVESLHPSAVVSDVIIEPMYTALRRKAHAQGLKIHHGRNMMIVAMPAAADFYGFWTCATTGTVLPCKMSLFFNGSFRFRDSHAIVTWLD